MVISAKIVGKFWILLHLGCGKCDAGPGDEKTGFSKQLPPKSISKLKDAHLFISEKKVGIFWIMLHLGCGKCDAGPGGEQELIYAKGCL